MFKQKRAWCITFETGVASGSCGTQRLGYLVFRLGSRSAQHLECPTQETPWSRSVRYCTLCNAVLIVSRNPRCWYGSFPSPLALCHSTVNIVLVMTSSRRGALNRNDMFDQDVFTRDSQTYDMFGQDTSGSRSAPRSLPLLSAPKPERLQTGFPEALQHTSASSCKRAAGLQHVVCDMCPKGSNNCQHCAWMNPWVLDLPELLKFAKRICKFIICVCYLFCRKSKLLKHVLAIYGKIEASIELPILLLESPANIYIYIERERDRWIDR